jgi:hypothetical protein
VSTAGKSSQKMGVIIPGMDPTMGETVLAQHCRNQSQADNLPQRWAAVVEEFRRQSPWRMAPG